MSRPAPSSGPAEEARLRRRVVLVVVLLFLSNALFRASYFYLGARAGGDTGNMLVASVLEVTGGIAAVIAFFAVVVPAVRRWPLFGSRWLQHLPAHACALVAFSLLKTTLMWVGRAGLYPLLGLGRYDYGEIAFRLPMELSNDVLGYFVMVGAVHLWDSWRSARDREMQQVRWEASLKEARLQALQAQLQPHFLFNTLNVISSVMYTDPGRADRMMSGLADLIRNSLVEPARTEGAIEEELRLLDEYVDIMRARFGDRLGVQVDVDPRAREAHVPLMLLQPLVENAIQHGVAKRAGPGHVHIRVMRDGADLLLEVTDNGPGLSGDTLVRGIGIANARERLRHLYGDRARLTLTNRSGGGVRAEVRLPFTRAAHRRDEPTTSTGRPAERDHDHD